MGEGQAQPILSSSKAMASSGPLTLAQDVALPLLVSMPYPAEPAKRMGPWVSHHVPPNFQSPVASCCTGSLSHRIRVAEELQVDRCPPSHGGHCPGSLLLELPDFSGGEASDLGPIGCSSNDPWAKFLWRDPGLDEHRELGHRALAWAILFLLVLFEIHFARGSQQQSMPRFLATMVALPAHGPRALRREERVWGRRPPSWLCQGRGCCPRAQPCHAEPQRPRPTAPHPLLGSSGRELNVIDVGIQLKGGELKGKLVQLGKHQNLDKSGGCPTACKIPLDGKMGTETMACRLRWRGALYHVQTDPDQLSLGGQRQLPLG